MAKRYALGLLLLGAGLSGFSQTVQAEDPPAEPVFTSLTRHPSLLYAGETKALNLFLDALAQCPGVTVHVSFVADPIPGEPCDWQVLHEASPNSFHIRVNLQSERIKLPDLYLPSAKGPALPAESSAKPQPAK